MKVKFKKMTKNAIIPTRKLKTDAGIDFYSMYSNCIMGHSSCIIPLNIAWQVEDIPVGYNVYMQIQSRSGLAFNYSIECTNAGVIDQNYRGCISVKLYNMSNKTYYIKMGDRIAQGVIKLLPQFEIEEALVLDDTDRGNNGFGSSGK